MSCERSNSKQPPLKSFHYFLDREVCAWGNASNTLQLLSARDVTCTNQPMGLGNLYRYIISCRFFFAGAWENNSPTTSQRSNSPIKHSSKLV